MLTNRTLVLIGFLFFSLILKGQQFNCNLLGRAINNKQFRKFFFSSKNDTILIYDKIDGIYNCDISKCCKGRFEFTFDKKFDSIYPGYIKKDYPKNLIILYNTTINNEEISISFWRPSNDTTLRFFYKPGDYYLKLIKLERGAF